MDTDEQRVRELWKAVAQRVGGTYLDGGAQWLVGRESAPGAVEVLRELGVDILWLAGFNFDGIKVHPDARAIAGLGSAVGTFHDQVDTDAADALRVLDEIARLPDPPAFIEFALLFEDECE